ncbi:MAG: hypothetical protein ACREJ9_12040 [Candidatus Rokuibacteriota bacterium]
MNLFAHHALTASVVASALGGIVLTLLLFLDATAPSDDEAPDVVRRRRFVLRLGHTVAAACFAATAVLATVVMSRQSGPRPGDAGRLDEEIRALDTRVSAVETLVQRIAASVETLVRRVEADDAVSTSIRSSADKPAASPR